MRLVVTLGCALALVPGVAAGQALDTSGATQCQASGYATDKDPRGTNVRSAPRADAPVIGHLAPFTKIDRDTERALNSTSSARRTAGC
jgi:hypothetical protein